MKPFEWKRPTGDGGRISVANGQVLIQFDVAGLSLMQAHEDWPLLRALHAALGKALDAVAPQPVTDSISSALAACSAPVPSIVRVQPTGVEGETSIDVTTGDGAVRFAVQCPCRVVRAEGPVPALADSLEPIEAQPSQPEPPPILHSEHAGKT